MSEPVKLVLPIEVLTPDGWRRALLEVGRGAGEIGFKIEFEGKGIAMGLRDADARALAYAILNNTLPTETKTHG